MLAASRPREIAVLSSDALRTAYNWTEAVAGNVEAVVYAAFEHPSAGTVDAYAKFYSPASRGMVNEVTGYLLAKACGLPTPTRAFFASVPIAALPTPFPRIVARAAELKATTALAFCTQDVAPQGVAPIVVNAQLKDELQKWRSVTACVAFDEHSANADRHLKNFVRRGMRDYVLIDHGRLAWKQDAPDWTPKTLEPLGDYANRLSEILWGHAPPDDVASATVKAGREHIPKLGLVIDELRFWWTILVGSGDDGFAWERFITERLAGVEYLIRRRYRLLT